MASEVENADTLEAAGSWTNEANFTGAADDSCMTATADGTVSGEFSFAFTEPSGTIDGIEVTLHHTTGDANDYVQVELEDSTSTWRAKAVATPATSSSTCSDSVDKSVGGAADTWGGTWTAAWIKSSDFRIRVTALKSGKEGAHYGCDSVTVTVTYTSAAFTPKQHNWQWHENDAAEPTTQLADENVKPTGIDRYDKIRLRVCIHETGGAAGSNQDLAVEYSTNDVDFTACGAQNTDATDWSFADGAATEHGTTTTYLVSCGDEHGDYHETACTNGVNITADKHHEIDITLQNMLASANTTYYFRIKLETVEVGKDSGASHPQVQTHTTVYYYTDNFEGAETGYTIGEGGSGDADLDSATQKHGGSQSLKIYSPTTTDYAYVYHAVTEVTGNFHCKIWVYADSSIESDVYAIGFYDVSGGAYVFVTILKYQDAAYWIRTARAGGDDDVAEITADAWHEIDVYFDDTNNKVKYWVDDAYKGEFDVMNGALDLDRVYMGDTSAGFALGYMYLDDVSIDDTSAPAVGIASRRLLVGVGA